MLRSSLLAAAVLLLVAPLTAQGQDLQPLTYQMPAPGLAALVDAPVLPAVLVSPDRSVLLLGERPPLPGIEELAQPELGLAGIRINPRTTGPSRARTVSELRVLSLDEEAGERKVSGLPEDARIRNIAWSPDGRFIAFTLDRHDHVGLYVAGVDSAAARRLTPRVLNDAVPGAPFRWTSAGELVVRAVPVDRGEAPPPPHVPPGPTIQETSDEAAPARTFQDLLENPYDEALFEYYLESELLRVSVGGEVSSLGIRGLITSFQPSPDANYLLVHQTSRPFSYLVPLSRFSQSVSVHALPGGGEVAQIAELPVAENVPIGFGSVATGPRGFTWRNDAPATLLWAEAQDEGDIRQPAELRDRLFVLDAPFEHEPRAAMELALRFGGITWIDTGEALVDEWEWQSRIRRTHLVDFDDPAAEPRLLVERSIEDRYADPGQPLTRPNAFGQQVAFTSDEGELFLAGTGASPEGNRPFLRRLNLDTGEVTELFRSAEPHYESPLILLDPNGGRLITRRESPAEPPNFYLRDLHSGTLSPLTSYPHPYPELAGVHREVLQYERADGLPLTATLYLPPGYDAERDGPLPTLLWAYPREFRSADAAGQRTDSPFRFTRIAYAGAVPYVTRGFAVLDAVAMPIVGEGDAQPNDTFVEQLIANAEAAIDEGARRGVVDPRRVAVAGHSYGAFMAANLIAHSDLFRAGIARSGAYNRTFTPFGFQREERTYWEAPDIYNTMSPFMNADRINQPLLLIHGEEDNNSGTFPIQSERLFNAVRGLGGSARLVMLPHESHGYRARESVLHVLWETDRWLRMHLAGEGDPGASAGG